MSNAHTEYSSFRENVIEHLFIGRCLQELWKQQVFDAEVLRADVDGSGYDIVIEARQQSRHIQLKASFDGAAKQKQKINIALAAKPSGCVVWIVFDPDTLDFLRFLWFGSGPGCPLPSLEGFETGRHSKGDASGNKAERAHPDSDQAPFRGNRNLARTVAEAVWLKTGSGAEAPLPMSRP